MAKAKVKKIKEKLIPVAQYIADIEVMMFGKLVNKGDIVPEMPLKEAEARGDFKVIFIKEKQ